MEQYQVTLKGLTPLLMHSDNLAFSERVQAWQKAPENKANSKAGDDRSPAWTWIGYLYHDGKHVGIPADNLMTMLREAGTNFSLIVFPEGSRSVTGEVGEFKSGLYYIAKKRPDIELIPVHIDNLNRVLPRGEFLPVPLLSCISFGPPLWLERDEAKLDFLARARRAVLSLKE